MAYLLIYLGEARSTDSPTITGVELRELFDLQYDGDLIVEGQGSEPDRIVADYDVIRLSEAPTRIFVRPPTMFGS